VSKDFETVDSNSNLATRSKHQRGAPLTSNGKQRRAEKKTTGGREGALPPPAKSAANEVLKHAVVVAATSVQQRGGPRHGQNHTTRPATTVPGAGSVRDAPSSSPSSSRAGKPDVAGVPGVSVVAGSEQQQHQKQPKKKEVPQCEISGKEVISALSRAKSRECRQQIVEVYCKHKEGTLMPLKVPRYCPREGTSPTLLLCRAPRPTCSESR